MVQEYWNAAFRAAKLPRWFFVRRPEEAMVHAAFPRSQRELPMWRMAAALRIDMVGAIRSGDLTRDAPLDLLHSITRRCAACHCAERCLAALVEARDMLPHPPEYCRVRNRLSGLAARHPKPVPVDGQDRDPSQDRA